MWCQWCFRWLFWEIWRSWLVGSASPSFMSWVVSLETSPLPCSCPTELRWVFYMDMHANKVHTYRLKNKQALTWDVCTLHFWCLDLAYRLEQDEYIFIMASLAMKSWFNFVICLISYSNWHLTRAHMHTLAQSNSHMSCWSLSCSHVWDVKLWDRYEIWLFPPNLQNPLTFLKWIKDPMICPAVVLDPLFPFI